MEHLDKSMQHRCSMNLMNTNNPSMKYDDLTTSLLPHPAGYPKQPAPVAIMEDLDHPVIGVGSQFALPYPTSLRMNSKNWGKFTLGNFDIHDTNDELVLRVKGCFELLSRRVITDSQGKAILTVREKFRTMKDRWVAYRGDSTAPEDKLFSIRKSKMLQFKYYYNVYMAGNKSEGVPDFRVKGSIVERSCRIMIGNSDVVVARVDEVCNAKTVFLPGKDKFIISVQPNMDYVLTVACMIVVSDIDAAVK